MPLSDQNHQREDLENQVWNAIAAFEQIVETIPNDRVSLEALSHAYEQVGDLSRAREYLSRLVAVVIDEKDRDAAEMLRDRLALFAMSDPMARDTQVKIDAFLGGDGGETQEFDLSKEETEVAVARNEEAERRSAHVASELSFAWTLFQAGELTQEEYALVAQDLSTISATSALVTVSVLHTLHDRVSRSLDRVLAFSARDSGVPVIPLSLFDIPDSVFGLIPREFMVQHGVMAFEVMGNDVLVVLQNPYNKPLREKVEAVIKRRCHFFLTPPADFVATLEKHGRKEAAKPEEKKSTSTP